MPLSEAMTHIRRELGAMVGFSMLINVLMLVSPISMLQVYHGVLSSGSLDTPLYLTLIAVVALGVYGVLEHVRRQLLNRAGDWLVSVVGPLVIAASQEATVTRWPGGGTGAAPARRDQG